MTSRVMATTRVSTMAVNCRKQGKTRMGLTYSDHGPGSLISRRPAGATFRGGFSGAFLPLPYPNSKSGLRPISHTMAEHQSFVALCAALNIPVEGTKKKIEPFLRDAGVALPSNNSASHLKEVAASLT